MEFDEERTFDIDRGKYPGCPLRVDSYRIKKEYVFVSTDRAIGSEGNMVFFVIDNEEFVLRNDENFPDAFRIRGIYQHEIGYIRCRPGLIEQVWINDGRMSMLNPHYRANARGCGISTILAKLCMKDLQIYAVDNENKALDLLIDEGLDYETRRNVEEHCVKFVGLFMIAEPPVTAHAYFSAAIESGYDRMLIEYCDNRYHNLYDIAMARQNYDPNTGNIGQIPSKNKNWYFCQTGQP